MSEKFERRVSTSSKGLKPTRWQVHQRQSIIDLLSMPGVEDVEINIPISREVARAAEFV